MYSFIESQANKGAESVVNNCFLKKNEYKYQSSVSSWGMLRAKQKHACININTTFVKGHILLGNTCI